MENEELDVFLKGEEAPAPELAPALPAVEAAPVSETEEDEEIALEPGRVVPVEALQAERSKRKDWKEKSLKLEGEYGAYKAAKEAELKALQDKLEAAARVTTPAPPPAPVQPQIEAPWPNPAEDPAGYAQRMATHLRQQEITSRAQSSELRLKQEKTAADVDAKLASFVSYGLNQKPGIREILEGHPDPIRLAYEMVVQHETKQAEEAAKAAALAEIGDPVAYREKLKAELLAEMQTQSVPQRQAPPAPQFQSLAGSRSVQSRSTPVPQEPSLSELFPN